MPELPEVETIRRGLDPHVVGREIVRVRLEHARVARRHPAGGKDLVRSLVGRRVVATGRRGKFLWLRLGDGSFLTIHLGMSGQLRVAAGGEVWRHERARLEFSDGLDPVRFVDQRTFGFWIAGPAHAEDPDVPDAVAHVARDPLDPRFDRATVARRVRASHRPVKALLLDQGLVGGIGNIYADEALWRGGVHWSVPGRDLSNADVDRLLDATVEVLASALVAGGTSFDGLMRHVDGSPGGFGERLRVYGRAGVPCPRCGEPITRERFGGRSSFVCRRCQRLTEPATS